MSENNIKVRIFDMEHGLVEYENVKTVKIVSKDYNLLIMKDYLSVIGEIVGNVEFKNIRFAYVDEKYVLDDVSLNIEAGMKVGIVGHTGSGKSSMMNLLLGYNDYQFGNLFVDGVDIKEYNKTSYRKNLGIVLQTPALFAGTINFTSGYCFLTMATECKSICRPFKIY